MKKLAWLVLLGAVITMVLLVSTRHRVPVRDAVTSVSKIDVRPQLPEAGKAKPVAESIQPTNVFASFREWSRSYLNASVPERASMVDQGIAIAKARRPILKELIRTDPRRALQEAVPMVLRQDLPPAILDLLEERVNGPAALRVYQGVGPDNRSPVPTFRIAEFASQKTYEAYVYGRRSESVRWLSGASLNGIAVDNQFAVHEDPLRVLEIGERPDPIKPAISVCPVSGESSVAEEERGQAITEGTPAIEAFGEIVYLCNGSHATIYREQLIQAEGGTGAPIPFTGILPAAPTASIGNVKVLVIPFTFADQNDTPSSETVLYQLMRDVGDHYAKASYGKLTLLTTVTPPVKSPHNEAWYIQKDSSNGGNIDGLGLEHTHARAEARKMGFDDAEFDCVVVRLRGGARPAGGYGGGSSVWIYGDGIDVTAHEIGHSFGLAHANFWNTSGASAIGVGANEEYGGHWDVMGGIGLPYGHYNAAAKNQIRWLPDAFVTEVTSSGLYRLYAQDQAILDPAKRYALKIRKDASRMYWGELRGLYTGHATRTWADFGFILGWRFPGGGGSNIQLIDTTPGSPFGKDDSPISLGRTFSDTEAGIHLTTLAVNPATSDEPKSVDVMVNIGGFAANQPPTLSLTASATVVPLNVPVTFAATASDPDGDVLAYSWQNFGDANYRAILPNSPTITRAFTAAGSYVISCTVSDMKGGSALRSLLVTVGNGGSRFTISGRVAIGAQGLPGVLVNANSANGVVTDSDGYFTIPNLTAGTYVMTPLLYGYTFTELFNNSVTLGPNFSGADFDASGTAVVSLQAAVPSCNEVNPSAPARFDLVRSGDAAQALVVNVLGPQGTATLTSDYAINPAPASGSQGFSTLTIPAGAPSLSVTVTPVNDSVGEGPETVVLELGPGNGYLIQGLARATVVIDDDDTTVPKVSLAVGEAKTIENSSSPATIVFSRTGATGNALTVPYAVSGSATTGADFAPLNGSFTIPAGQSSASLSITSVNDSVSEPLETVIIAISGNASLIPDPVAASATVSIVDDDVQVVTVVATDAIATERDLSQPDAVADTATFLVTRNGDTSEPLTVYYALSGVNSGATATALHGVDYEALPGVLVIPAGQTSGAITVIPRWDGIGEGPESVTLQLGAGPTNYRLGAANTASITINDAGDPPYVEVLGIDNAVEPSTVGHFRFSLKGSLVGTGITVNYTVSGTATSGADYSALSGAVTIPANGVSTVDVNVTPINDSIGEDLETITVTITPGAGYTIFPPSSTATIWLRDDERPTLFVDAHTSSYPPSITENGTGASFYISRVGSTNAALTVNYAMSGTAVNGADYQTLSGAATIPAGRLGVDVTVTPINDMIVEGAETITMTLTPGAGYGAGPPATFYLTDDETPSVSVQFASTAATGSESAGTVNVPVTLNTAAASPVTVEYLVDASSRASTTLNGTGASSLPYWVRSQRIGGTVIGSISADGTNWTGVSTQTVAFPAGTYLAGLYVCSFNVSVLCTSVFDNVTITDLQPGGTLGARTGGNIGATALGGSSSQLGNTYTVAGGGDNVEGTTDQGYFTWWPVNNSANCTITARVVSQQNTSSGATAGVMIRETTANNVRRAYMAATPGVGFEFHYRAAVAAQEAKVTRIASKPLWVRLQRIGNLIRSFQSLDGLAWTLIGGNLDLSFGPEVLLGLTVTSQAEGGLAKATFNNVTLTPGPLPLLQGRTIGFTAIQGSDSLDAGEYRLSGSADGINGTHDDCYFVAAPVAGDFVMTAQITSLESTTGSPQAGLMVRENTLRAARMVYIGGSPTPQVVYRNTTLTIAHGAGIDYTLAPGLLTFPPGATTQNIPLTIINDSIPEPDETIEIILRNANNARLGTINQFTYLIVDDDSPPALPFAQFAAASSSVSENAGTAQVAVALSVPAASTATVDYAITAGTATADNDFTPATGTLTFNPGDSVGMIPVAIDNDDINEPSETILLALSNPVGLRLSTITNHTLAIFDDDTPTLTISSTDTNATESGDTALVTITRTGSTNTALTINLSRSGNATPGVDYTGINSTATLAAGETSVTLTLIPLQDSLSEGTELAAISLLVGTGYVLDRPFSITNFIADDDRNTIFIAADEPLAYEGGQAGTITITREGNTNSPLNVNLTVTGTASGSDYTTTPLPVTPLSFAAGQTTRTIGIQPIDDAVTEGDEMVLVQVAAGLYDIGGVGYASVTIRDNDIPPTVFISSPAAQGVVIAPGNGVEFVAEAEDNGFPQPLTYLWSLVTGPGTIAFGSPTAASTPAIFSASGTYLVRVTVSDGQFTVSDQITINVGPTNNLVPSDWISADVGPPTLRGFSGLSGSNWVLSAAGAGFTADSDRAHAVSRQATGDATIIARLNSLTGPAGSEAGLGVRDSMHRYARRAALIYQANSRTLRFRPRVTNHTVDTATSVGSLNLPLWLRLDRNASNNLVSAYYAPDVSGGPGTWIQIGNSTVISMDATADYSLTADSASDTVAAIATFGQLTLTPAAAGPAMLTEDFGDGTQAGTYSYTAATDAHTLNGRGSLDGSGMFWGEQFTGDFILTALQLDATSNANDSRSGIMIRDSMDDGPMVFLGRNPQGAFSCFVWRTNPKGGTAGLNGITAKQRWFRLIRRGNQVTAMHAPNNSGVPGAWVQLGLPQTVFLQPTIIAGLYCDNAGGIGFNTATFTKFSVVPLNKAPIVDAGTAPINPSSPLSIFGTVRDDGLPDPFASFWSVASAPGPVAFANSNALSTSVTFGDRGNYVLRLWADDGMARSFDDLSFSLNTPFQSWQAAHFVGGSSNPNAAPDADPDGDSMDNIGEYAFGTDPNVVEPHAVVASIVIIGQDQFLRVTIPKNPGAADVTISVETSPQLSAPVWTNAGLITEQDTATLLQVRYGTPITAANERFARVRVTLSP